MFDGGIFMQFDNVVRCDIYLFRQFVYALPVPFVDKGTHALSTEDEGSTWGKLLLP